MVRTITFTICPDIPGNVIYLTFFVLQPEHEQVNRRDRQPDHPRRGQHRRRFTLGHLHRNSALQNTIVSGTVFNTSGCLTLVFHSNAVGTGVWAAGFQCTTPCEHPTSVAAMPEAIRQPL
jgi:hypothetical protein